MALLITTWLLPSTKKNDEEPRNIINTLLNTRHGPTHVMIVDDDINVYDPFDVEWALATRTWADRDVIIVPGVPSADEPTAEPGRGKLGIDATAPLTDRYWYNRIKVPGLEKVDYV